MSDISRRDNLTEEQLKALDEAAMLMIKARRQGATILRQAGLKDVRDDEGPFGSRCDVTVAPGRRCPCESYTGDSIRCETITIVPGIGERRCGHRPGQHPFS